MSYGNDLSSNTLYSLERVLDSEDIPLFFAHDKNKKKILFGIAYKRIIVNDNARQEIPEIDISYIDDNELLRARGHSQQELNHYILYPEKDLRWRVFGSEEKYISYFKELNEKNKRGIIEDEQYMRNIIEINKESASMVDLELKGHFTLRRLPFIEALRLKIFL